MSKASAAAGRLFANILCIAGALVGAPFIFVTFWGFAAVGFEDMFPSFFIFLAIDIACAAVVVCGIKIKQRISLFDKYVHLVLQKKKTLLRDLAKETGRERSLVKKDLQSMIKLKYFSNTYIDEELQEIIVARTLGGVDIDALMMEIVVCQSCGAQVKKQSNILSYCEYCGSPVD